MRIIIKNECEFVKKDDMSALGVRVQTSGTSDPTYKDAERNVSLEKAIDLAICSGDYHELEGRMDEERLLYHLTETITMGHMLEDYELCQNAFKYVNPEDIALLKAYLLGEKKINDLAVEYELSYEGLRSRVRKSRTKLVNRMTHVMSQKYKVS